jgi:hypothetical protein
MNERQMKIWQKLCTRSKRAMSKTKKKYDHPYFYNPRGHLLQNIANRFNITVDEAYFDLLEIRAEVLKRQQ